MASSATKKTVAVTGAGGRTGSLVVKQLLEQPDVYDVRIIARSTKAATNLGLPESAVYLVDITAPDSVEKLTRALQGCSALVIGTSAVPQLRWGSLPGFLGGRLFGNSKALPQFWYKDGQTPEKVDWLGQKVQVDAAKAVGAEHVVLISSIGGTQPDHFLNRAGDRIVEWKRKAEQYLIASGLQYTIIHPGGLVDKPGGERQLVVGVDDEFSERGSRQIPRADVATLCVQSLSLPGARNRSFDVVSNPAGQGAPTTDFAALLASVGDCDYSINSQLDPSELAGSKPS